LSLSAAAVVVFVAYPVLDLGWAALKALVERVA